MEKEERTKNGTVWVYKFDGDISKLEFKKLNGVCEAFAKEPIKQNEMMIIKDGRELN